MMGHFSSKRLHNILEVGLHVWTMKTECAAVSGGEKVALLVLNIIYPRQEP